jgi:cell division protein ZapA (FtsZ GTPase activity inhibitor)
MHVEPLEKLPRSAREFLSHYAMIVLSILTALALEQGVLRIEHHHQGERARNDIEQEIERNRHEVEESLATTHRYVQTWEALLERTVVEVDGGQSTNGTLLATIDEAKRNFGDSTPALTSAAWDAALASRAVDYLDHEELTRFSELYAFQRFFSQALWDTVRDSASRGLSDVSLPLYLGKADPVQTITMLNARVRTLRIMESQLTQIDVGMKKALNLPTGTAAASAPAH